MSVERTLGVVMAGGASRRMGFDKRRLEFEGQTLVGRSALVLASVFDEVAISVQPDAIWEENEFRAIRDRWAGRGPLAGLEAALGDVATDASSVFLLACDLPNVGTDAVRHVLACAARNRGCSAAVPSIAGRRQPLCALYRPSVLAPVRRQLETSDRSMRALLEAIEVLEVEIEAGLPFFRSDLFLNLNHPADLAAVEARAER